MRKYYGEVILLALAFCIMLFPSIVDAVDKSAAPLKEHITIQNNAGTPDTIKVVNLKAGDVVKVYNEDQSSLLGQAKCISKTVTIKITQLGQDAGTIQVTVTSAGLLESDPTSQDYAEEPQTPAPDPNNITIVNNAGLPDTIKIVGLLPNDMVKIFDTSVPPALLRQVRVARTAKNVTAKVSQLGAAAGTIQVTVTRSGMLESDYTLKDYDAEQKSSPLDEANIIITNNAGTSDTVEVKGLAIGDIIKVYAEDTLTTVLGKASQSTSAKSVVIKIKQLPAAGTVYLTVTNSGKAESDPAPIAYPAEMQTAAPTADAITVVNNAGGPDAVTVTAAAGDLVKVYSDIALGTLLGQATVAKNATSATITIKQLGTAAGSVYVTITGTGQAESNATEKAYDAEVKSTAPNADDIVIVNNAGTPDTVTITGVEGDTVSVYADLALKTLLGQAVTAKGATSAVVTIKQLGTAAGAVYVTITSTGKGESDPTPKDYAEEPKSDAPDPAEITVTNNAGMADIVEVVSDEGNVVKVYADLELKTLLGQATVAKGAASAVVSISQLPEEGNIYVTLTSKDKCESDAIQVTYDDEIQSAAPELEDIFVVNHAGIPDIIKVDYLDPGDVAKVYARAESLSAWGQATVANNDTSAPVIINQLGSAAGSIYVSVTRKGMLESERIEKSYDAEAKSPALDPVNITITNNVGIPGTVVVKNLQPGDAIKIYEDSKLAIMLGQASVAAGGTTATITIKDLLPQGGKLYLTITKYGLLESDSTEQSYAAYTVSEAPNKDYALIINNPGTDLVIVYGLNPGETIKVYQDTTLARVVGTATVAAKQTQVIMTVSQLGADGGTVYLTRTCVGELESSPEECPVEFAAE
ncbi:MAG: hypothetical protein ACM3MK_00390 [Chitinophagales bacterium]